MRGSLYFGYGTAYFDDELPNRLIRFIRWFKRRILRHSHAYLTTGHGFEPGMSIWFLDSSGGRKKYTITRVE